MKMKNLVLILSLSISLIFMMGCDKKKDLIIEEEEKEEIIPEDENDPSKLPVEINVNGINAVDFYKNCHVNSILDEVPVSENTMRLKSVMNKKVQTYYLTDAGDDPQIYMMSRVSDTDKNKKIVFDVESTALAFVTQNPFFAHIDSLAYDLLIDAIRRNQYFPMLCNEMNNLITQKKDIASSDNIQLIETLGLLLENLIDFPNVQEDSDSISRAIQDDQHYPPFRLNSRGRTLDMQVYWLNPSYYGTATHANGDVTKLEIPSHDDYGVFDLISVLGDLIHQNGGANQYGKIESYEFREDGECIFNLSCHTEENKREHATRILSAFLDIIGLGMDEIENWFLDRKDVVLWDFYQDTVDKWEKRFKDYNNIVSSESLTLKYGVFPFIQASGEETGWLENVDLIEFLQDLFLLGFDELMDKLINDNEIHAKQLRKIKKFANKLCGPYFASKSFFNLTTRMILHAKAADPVEFQLCCYNDEIGGCTKILKFKGDGQEGTPGQELELPIIARVSFSEIDITSKYQIVFSVEKGGGSISEVAFDIDTNHRRAETKWTLGYESAEQTVKASLILKESGEEVCEPVYFTATAKGEHIYIISGNEQKGKAGERLNSPLIVGADNFLNYNSSYRVKFEVLSGGGYVSDNLAIPWEAHHNYKAQTYWVLGEDASQDQIVRAVLVDMYTEKELSEPVYFNAYAESQATTGEAYDVTEKSAFIHGSYKGISASMEFGMIYYTSNGAEKKVKGIFEEGQSEYVFSLSGLTPDTEYYYKSYILAGDTYIYGDTESFRTLPKTYKFRFIAKSSSGRFPSVDETFSVESEDYFFCDIKGYSIEYSKDKDLEHAWDEDKKSKLRVSIADDNRNFDSGAYQGGDMYVLWFYSNSFNTWFSPSLEVIYMVWASPVRRNKGKDIESNVRVKLEKLNE